MDTIYTDPALTELRMKRLENELLRLQGLMMLPVENIMLDMSKLPQQPPGIKLALIKWIIKGNEERIAKGDKAIVTKGLILACPLWKVIPIPFSKVELTSLGLLNPFKPEPMIGGRPKKLGSINKRQKR